MNVKPTLVRLGLDVPGRIDRALTGKEKRADFVRKAVEAELQRRESALSRAKKKRASA